MNKRIVIIGGMGPQASLELHRRIISGAAKAGAKDNEDYPEILHASIPIADFISSGDGKKGFRELTESLDRFKPQQEDKIIIACNTVHLLLPKLEARYRVKPKSLIEAAVRAVDRSSAKVVGLLASPTTINTGLYEKPLRKIGCRVLLPTLKEIDELEKAIRYVIANNPPEEAAYLIKPIIDRMLSSGASKVILGCTELSVIFSGKDTQHMIDPLTEVLNE